MRRLLVWPHLWSKVIKYFKIKIIKNCHNESYSSNTIFFWKRTVFKLTLKINCWWLLTDSLSIYSKLDIKKTCNLRCIHLPSYASLCSKSVVMLLIVQLLQVRLFLPVFWSPVNKAINAANKIRWNVSAWQRPIIRWCAFSAAIALYLAASNRKKAHNLHCARLYLVV